MIAARARPVMPLKRSTASTTMPLRQRRNVAAAGSAARGAGERGMESDGARVGRS